MSAEIASWPGRRPAYVQPAVPTKQCVRADEEGLLARSPQKSTGRSEEDTIGVLRARAGDLSAKDRKLMSEHDDHELLEITRTQTQRRHREDAPKQQIRQRHEQGQDSLTQDADGPTLRSRSHLRVVERPDGFTHPIRRSPSGRKGYAGACFSREPSDHSRALSP